MNEKEKLDAIDERIVLLTKEIIDYDGKPIGYIDIYEK